MTKHYYAQTYDFFDDREPEVVQKTWGTEEHIYNMSHCVKIMKIKPRHQVSTHWHSKKSETFSIISGLLYVETRTRDGEPRLVLLNPGDSITIEPNVPHTFYCPDDQKEETTFIESSTFDSADDSYRVHSSRER
jgi:mannose-6-phosphate isomerase-like protein (cupin superfamily)